MSEPLTNATQVSVQAHSIEMGMTARVIMDAKGNPASMVLAGQHGMEVKAPGEAFPFVLNGHPVLVVVTVVQVSTPQPTLAGPVANGIIRTAN